MKLEKELEAVKVEKQGRRALEQTLFPWPFAVRSPHMALFSFFTSIFLAVLA